MGRKLRLPNGGDLQGQSGKSGVHFWPLEMVRRFPVFEDNVPGTRSWLCPTRPSCTISGTSGEQISILRDTIQKGMDEPPVWIRTVDTSNRG
jgi:hypothetical protein